MSTSHSADHAHPHGTTPLPGGPHVTRRDLMLGAALGVGAIVTEGLLDGAPAVAADGVVDLPGFRAFSDSVTTLKSGGYYLVESDGIPHHNMMVGITNWQQQVPVPMPYTGANAWSIPVKPVKAAKAISAKTDLFRGAIAVAADGIPIFNALNNRGEDAYLIGELDRWGGHCGRADDYHYHVAPLHLSKKVGRKNPIAYALDGYAIYGSIEPDGSRIRELDELNGHVFQGKYHYHGTTTYPYINGGMRGQVTVRDGQIEPQAATRPFRAAGEPLSGASITSFERLGQSRFRLTYLLQGRNYLIDYVATLDSVTMSFTDPTGATSTETYSRQGR